MENGLLEPDHQLCPSPTHCPCVVDLGWGSVQLKGKIWFQSLPFLNTYDWLGKGVILGLKNSALLSSAALYRGSSFLFLSA